MAADLDTLITADIPEGRQNLLDSYTNLERVAEYCENNYYQCENKRAALEETKSYTTQSLASVAYQINTLAYNFLQALDLQASQLSEMESQVNHITQTVGIHKEKVARREIGVLTTNKTVARQYKIIAPASPERPMKYNRKPIDYSILDTIGHGVRVQAKQYQPMTQQQIYSQQQQRMSNSPYGQGMMANTSGYGSVGNVSTNSAGPAPTTKPPTPPQAVIYSSGTLNRSKDYRTPPVVAPPQVPSNYAPNYPMQQQQQQQYQKGLGKQYGTLPHPQIQMVHPVQQPNEISGGATMPRLSSSSMRSTSSHSSNEYHAQSSTLGRPIMQQQLLRQSSATPPGSMGSHQGVPPLASNYGLMNKPSQRPPSPPLPPPPMQQQMHSPQQQQLKYLQQQQQQQQMQHQQYNPIYSRQMSEPSSSRPMSNIAAAAAESVYARQLSAGPPQQFQLPRPQVQQQQPQMMPPPPPSQLYDQRQSNPILPMDKSLPGWVPKNYLERVTAIYDYVADKDDELSFQEGSIIYVLKKNDDGWWEGVMDGVTGLFPGNYVEANI